MGTSNINGNIDTNADEFIDFLPESIVVQTQIVDATSFQASTDIATSYAKNLLAKILEQ